MPGKPSDPEPSGPWQQASLALTLPMMMAAGPVVGYFLGWGIARLLHFSDAWVSRMQIIGIILGLIAAARETVKVIKKISKP